MNYTIYFYIWINLLVSLETYLIDSLQIAKTAVDIMFHIV